MRKRNLSLITAILLVATILLPGALPAFAEGITGNFESFTLGNVNGQDGWSKTGAYDVAVVTNSYGYASFGTKSLRISNAVTSGGFGDQTFAKQLVNEAGETTAYSVAPSGIRQNTFVAQWDFASTVPGAEQPGLSITASPDRGDGGRMSWIQMTDTPTGLEVNFYDYQDKPPYGSLANPADGRDDVGDLDDFYMTNVASGLARNVPHTIRLEMAFVDGPHNDVVKVYVDGVLKHTGTSWEDYFRWMQGPGDPEQTAPVHESRTVRTMLFRAGGAAASATLGNGFVIDNFSTSNPAVVPASTPWFFYDDGFPGGIGNFVTGPATPPLGVGSLHLALPGAVGARMAYGTAAYAGTRLDQITTLGYSTYRSSVDAGNNLAIALQFDMDYNLLDANTAWQGRLVFEPYMAAGGTVLQDTWQAWDALSGKWWASGAPGNTLCPQAAPCTWAQVLTNWPDAGLRAGIGYLWLKAGGPADGFDGNADALKIGLTGVDTTYDFEPTELKATTTDALFCVGETTTVDIDLAGVTNLYGYEFKVGYDTSKASAAGAFVNSFFDTADPASKPWNATCAAGVCKFAVSHTGGSLGTPQQSVSGSGVLAKITFTGVAPGPFNVTIYDDILSDIDGATLTHNLGAPLPLTVCGSATVSGKVTLQGRPGNNVNPGTVTFTDLGGNFPPVYTNFSGTDGAFSLSVPVLSGGSNYRMDAAHGLYLTNRKTPVALTFSVPLANQDTRLWGGDANNSGKVEINDLSCIGGQFGYPLPLLPITPCAGGGSPDINADGKVNIQDLAITGGNFDKCGAQPWDWVGGTPITVCP